MKKRLFIVLFLCILFLGTFLRFYKLGDTPSSLDWDEVSWGYSAYSILMTGKDEHGVSYPLSFEGLGDFKQPLYIYVDTVPVKFFGLTAFAVRFPSAFFGSLSIIFVYLLVYELFRKEKYSNSLALFSMFFFSISPWSIQFSRVAFEANVALFFVILGTWIWIKGIHSNKNWYLFLGIVFLSLSAYTYHSEKIFLPLFFAGLVLCYFQYFWKRKILTIILGVTLLLCNIFWIADMRTTARGRSVLFTSQQTTLLNNPIQQTISDKKEGNMLGALTHNRRLVYAGVYIDNYLSHFNPTWLFMTGDNGRHHPPGMGILYLISLPFIIVGAYFFKKRDSSFWLLFAWLLLAPVASALAIDAPNASRSLVFLPTWHILEAMGWLVLLTRLPKNKWIKTLQIFLIVLLICNFYFFLHQYFSHTNTETQKEWQYGYKEAIDFTQKFEKSKIIYDNNIEQGYMFYLFYSKIDPNKYIKINAERKKDNVDCFSINNAYFGSCKDKMKKGDFYVTATPNDSLLLKLLRTVSYTNTEPAVMIYQVQ